MREIPFKNSSFSFQTRHPGACHDFNVVISNIKHDLGKEKFPPTKLRVLVLLKPWELVSNDPSPKHLTKTYGSSRLPLLPRTYHYGDIGITVCSVPDWSIVPRFPRATEGQSTTHCTMFILICQRSLCRVRYTS